LKKIPQIVSIVKKGTTQSCQTFYEKETLFYHRGSPEIAAISIELPSRAAPIRASVAKGFNTKGVLTNKVTEIIIAPVAVVHDPGSSRRDMPQTRKRRDARYDFPATIEYVKGSQTDDEVVHKAVTINLSSTGVGMYIFDLLPKGQQITIKTTLPVESRTAAICWTKRKDISFYRAGLKFI
jgi:hypothetical protein